ncbi:MAG: phosphoglucosamine mutase [Chlamydiales bacterium]|nr:phosphoglucosamine mutase [Chlamydiia bacterium]MCP5507053.1 phosphoglucosamine mutase [Chlamydiales bacterium]
MSDNSKKIFGTDGVRGRANHYPMTVETALALGRAAGKLFRSHQGKHRVVIGKDTRLSCYMFENALIAGLCSMGVDTLMVGPLPTPGVAFITRAYRADAGIVISASHNPYYDNGIKFFSSEGFKLPDSWESEMEELIYVNDFNDSLPADGSIGKNTKIDDAMGRYIEFAKGTFPRRESLGGMKIALDSANGAGYKVAPLIFRELGAEVFELGNRPNGLNINSDCGSLHPENVQKALLEFGADVGIALDGDADRVIMVDEHAQIIDGDIILAICARDMQERGTLRNNKIVSTVMCNLGLVKAMGKLGIEVIQTKVGDRNVIQAMLDHDANLGGEQSGHVIFSDFNTTGDGLVSALQVLRVMRRTGKKLSELAALVTKFPQALVNVKVSSKPPLESLIHVQDSIEQVQKHLENNGRVLVRYSGTEFLCRVMVEGEDAREVQEFADMIAKVINTEIGTDK